MCGTKMVRLLLAFIIIAIILTYLYTFFIKKVDKMANKEIERINKKFNTEEDDVECQQKQLQD